MDINKECKTLRGLSPNKKGWFWVYSLRDNNVGAGNWFCEDYNIQCEKCREAK